MVFTNFRINILLRLAAIIVSVIALVLLAGNTDFFVTELVLGVVTVALTANLLHYIETTKREIGRFVSAVHNEDFSQTFRGRRAQNILGNTARELDAILDKFRETRAVKEEQWHFFQAIIQHVSVGLLGFRRSGKVTMINDAARELLGVSYLSNINQFTQFGAEFPDFLNQLRPGKPVVIRIPQKSQTLQLRVESTEIKQRGILQKIVSIQNIHGELEEKELEAWQNLIQVMAHEINNSLTPVSSLAGTAKGLLERLKANSTPGEDKEQVFQDLDDALAVIEKRGQGLIHFVNNYRNLAKIPTPNLTTFPIEELFRNVQLLLDHTLKNQSIQLTITIQPEDLELTADSRLMEQVLINLLKNAGRALKDARRPEIQLKAFAERGSGVIQVIDNGKGIHPTAIEKIFIPLFKTDRAGAGIGLSISRQIMRLHGGSISVSSIPGKQTAFTLRFP